MDQGFVPGPARWKAALLVAGGLAVGAAAYAVASLRLTGVTPDEGAWVNRRQVALTATYRGSASAVELVVDGTPVPAELRPDRGEVAATTPALDNGPHRFELRLRSVLGVGGPQRAWTVQVDTTPPRVTLAVPAPGAIVRDRMLKIQGQSEPGARLSVRVAGPGGHAFTLAPFTADDSGRFSAILKMGDERSTIRIEAVDRAGNRGTLSRTVICDLAPPVVSDLYPAPGATIRLDPTVTVRAKVAESGSGVKRAVLEVDGKAHPVALAPTGGAVQLQLDSLPEGTREVVLEVEDRAGWKVRKEWTFLVNTTETFGARPATRGARGKDVAGLQKRLIKGGDLAAGHVTSIFDDETEKALQQFQARKGLDVDGKLGTQTIARLSPRIDIDLSRFTLVLYDDEGKKVKKYDIACGRPEFPTPTGRYRVTFLERNPTWIPPKDSVWAREAKVTPPGPGNPLGTRWIGLDSNAVGIHGTNAEWTIRSRASHGCIRMRIVDVEDLFERVNPGMRVSIFTVRPPQDAGD